MNAQRTVVSIAQLALFIVAVILFVATIPHFNCRVISELPASWHGSVPVGARYFSDNHGQVQFSDTCIRFDNPLRFAAQGMGFVITMIAVIALTLNQRKAADAQK